MVANPYKGDVALPLVDVPGFEAGGTLLLDVNALCSLEEVLDFGKGIDAATLSTPRVLRQVVQAGLEEHHGAVDDRTVGKIIGALGIGAMAELVMLSFTRSFPEAAVDGAGNPPKAAKGPRKGGTGIGSSASGAS